MLLSRMLRLSLVFCSFFVVFGPPLSEPFLRFVYTSRWATHDASTALSLYCWLLPLMAWNGLLEAFLRAASTTDELNRLQRAMVFESGVYVSACYVALHWNGQPVGSASNATDHSLLALIVANVVNMAIRCCLSIAQIRRTSAVMALITSDRIAGIVETKHLYVWAAFFPIARLVSLPVLITCVGPLYVAALLQTDKELYDNVAHVASRVLGRIHAH